VKQVFFVISIIIFFGNVFGQTPTPLPKRSHVERFSTPESRAIKNEVDLTEKIRLNQSDANLYNERALARVRLQKFDLALQDLQKATELNSSNAEFFANLGYVLWKVGKFQEAIETERKALKIDDKNYTANYQLGRFLLRLGDKNLLKEATEKLRKALEIDARQYEVRFELIAGYRELGEVALATAQVDLLQDARPADARVSYVAALIEIDKGNNKVAIMRFDDALRKDQNLFGAWQDLGLLYAKLNRWEEAVNAFSELSKRQQNSVESAYFHALSLYNIKKINEAESEIRRALRLDVSSAESLTLLGIILVSKKNADNEAIESLTQAVALQPNNFDANFYLGRVQYISQNYSEAQKNLQKAVELNPKNIEGRFFLGSVLEAMQNSENALLQYQEIIKLDEKSFFGQVGLGSVLLKQGKIDEAVSALNRAIALDKESFEANWALGRAFILQEKFADAENVLRKAVLLQPSRTDARYQFAIALRRLGKTEESKKEFDLVEKLNREFRQGQEN
jgi:tetratricopeptide (TPR) repeat protein